VDCAHNGSASVDNVAHCTHDNGGCPGVQTCRASEVSGSSCIASWKAAYADQQHVNDHCTSASPYAEKRGRCIVFTADMLTYSSV